MQTRHKNISGFYAVASIILKERLARINEKTVKITSGSSIRILQNLALIDNFDVRFWNFV